MTLTTLTRILLSVLLHQSQQMKSTPHLVMIAWKVMALMMKRIATLTEMTVEHFNQVVRTENLLQEHKNTRVVLLLLMLHTYMIMHVVQVPHKYVNHRLSLNTLMKLLI